MSAQVPVKILFVFIILFLLSQLYFRKTKSFQDEMQPPRQLNETVSWVYFQGSANTTAAENHQNRWVPAFLLWSLLTIIIFYLSAHTSLDTGSFESSPSPAMKKILFYTPFFSADDWNFGFGSNKFQKCPVSNCYITNNRLVKRLFINKKIWELSFVLLWSLTNQLLVSV